MSSHHSMHKTVHRFPNDNLQRITGLLEHKHCWFKHSLFPKKKRIRQGKTAT
jgi:hypothetical protein